MSEEQDNAPLPGLTRYQQIQFDGDELLAVFLDDGVAVPVRTVCKALGLDLDTQSAKLREHEVLSQGVRLVRVPQGQRVRTVVALLHRFIPFWLATIVPSQVNETARPKLVRYQIELVDLLASLYGGELQPATTQPGDHSVLTQRLTDALVELRLAREALLSVQQRTDHQLQEHETRIGAVEGLMDELQEQLASHTTITASQQEVIKRSITRLAARYKRRTGQEVFGKLFAQFCIDLGTPKYALLPSGKYKQALEWIQNKARELLPDDPEAVPPMQETLL